MFTMGVAMNAVFAFKGNFYIPKCTNMFYICGNLYMLHSLEKEEKVQTHFLGILMARLMYNASTHSFDSK